MQRTRMFIPVALLALALLLTGCGQMMAPAADTAEQSPATTPGNGRGPMGMGMGAGGGMMARHHATVPEEYAGLTNPVAADEASLARGAEIFAASCATCHGDGGMGDGPAAATLNPAPPAIAHTSQMLGDDYLFWRISEGGAMAPFNSAMPAWKAILDEGARWDVITYVRGLASGTVTPGRMMGGAAFDPAAEQARRSEMLATAVADGVITREEADTFDSVHAAMDTIMQTDMTARMGGASQMQQALLDRLLAGGTITQAQADLFNDVHDRLLEAGLMQ